MTILPALQGNEKSFDQGTAQLVDVSPDSKILVYIHRVENSANAPTMVLVHGLEGSSNSPYMVNLTRKSMCNGFNVVRMNMRNCGNTLNLTPTLYNAGLSGDVLALVEFLARETELRNFFVSGYSLGGNVVLKLAGELGDNGPAKLRGVCAVSPSIDLSKSIDSIETGLNRFYELRFLLALKRKIRQKSKLYPDRFDVSILQKVKGMRDFDDLLTAPDGGYMGGQHYYREASAIKVLNQIRIPALIIAAKDDPIVPFSSFDSVRENSTYIKLLSPAHGGHGGFIQDKNEVHPLLKGNDRLWAENRILEFCLRVCEETKA
jgi:hypothetical protein